MKITVKEFLAQCVADNTPIKIKTIPDYLAEEITLKTLYKGDPQAIPCDADFLEMEFGSVCPSFDYDENEMVRPYLAIFAR